MYNGVNLSGKKDREGDAMLSFPFSVLFYVQKTIEIKSLSRFHGKGKSSKVEIEVVPTK